MSEPRIRTSLQSVPAAGYRDADPERARELARNSYIATGGEVVLINRNWLRNEMDRHLLDALAKTALEVGEGG